MHVRPAVAKVPEGHKKLATRLENIRDLPEFLKLEVT